MTCKICLNRNHVLCLFKYKTGQELATFTWKAITTFKMGIIKLWQQNSNVWWSPFPSNTLFWSNALVVCGTFSWVCFSWKENRGWTMTPRNMKDNNHATLGVKFVEINTTVWKQKVLWLRLVQWIKKYSKSLKLNLMLVFRDNIPTKQCHTTEHSQIALNGMLLAVFCAKFTFQSLHAGELLWEHWAIPVLTLQTRADSLQYRQVHVSIPDVTPDTVQKHCYCWI